MERSNVHTSVVIELANEEEEEEQKRFKIDFDDMDPPKDYVIDQIFCGENITVYALFEISEEKNGKLDKQLVEVTSSGVNENYRFYHRNSYKKGTNETGLESLMDSKEVKLLSTTNQRNESLYCLKHFGESCDIPSQIEDSETQVLYSNDRMSESQRRTKFKAVSKGVNTDISQCPNLLEEMKRVVGLNFPFAKLEGKATRKSLSKSRKPSYELMEREFLQPSCSSFNSDVSSSKCGQGSSPNFLVVPFVMMDEGLISQNRKDGKHRKPIEEAKFCSDITRSPTAASLGTNMTVHHSRSFHQKEEHKGEVPNSLQSSPHQSDVITPCRSQTEWQIPTVEKPAKPEEKCEEEQKIRLPAEGRPTSKEAILEEIKNLQWKLDSLVKSLQFAKFDSNEASKSEEVAPVRVARSKSTSIDDMIVKNVTETSQSSFVVPDSLRRTRKFDELPIFSPLNCTYSGRSGSQKSRKKTLKADHGDKREVSLISVKSVTSMNSISCSGSSALHNIWENDRPQLELKADLIDFFTNWKGFPRSWKEVGLSKSASNTRCISDSKCSGLRKSLSLELHEEKLDAFGSKKVKNAFCKLEGCLKGKANVRIHQKVENPPGSNLTSLKREMGDERTVKPKNSKPEIAFLELDLSDCKDELLKVFEKDNAKKSKNQNKYEGDAKMYQKDGLYVSKFAQNSEKLTVHYCNYNPNTTVTTDMLKKKKSLISIRAKLKTPEKIVERDSKSNSESEKVSTPNKSQKVSTIDASETKDTKNKVNKSKNKPVEKSNKNETIKPKSSSGSRKSTGKAIPEVKFHADKMARKPSDFTAETKVESVTNHKSFQQAKQTKEEKWGGTSHWNRPLPQKREHRDIASTIHSKEIPASRKSSEPSLQTLSKISKNETIFQKKNLEPLTVFESKMKMPIAEIDNLGPEKQIHFSSEGKSPVLVELLSEKPQFIDEFHSEMDQTLMYKGENVIDDIVHEADFQKKVGNNDNDGKPIMKSVWALTKVLLYEDGTKKFEILEASLTPPDYGSLNENPTGDKIR